MTEISENLIYAIKKAAKKIRSNSPYSWGHLGSCNCGQLVQSLTNLNKDDTGKKIDKRARKFLKKSNLDYAHGTGHGVGFFLNVHEGPQSITKINTVKIREGTVSYTHLRAHET